MLTGLGEPTATTNKDSASTVCGSIGCDHTARHVAQNQVTPEKRGFRKQQVVVAENPTFREVGGGSLVPKACLQSERLRASVHERHRLTAGELGMIRDGFDDLLDR